MERPGVPKAGHGEVRTRCGRRIVVSRLVTGEDSPVGRVTVRINCQRGERGQLWAGLTAGEARLFAWHLLRQAGLLEHATGGRETDAGSNTSGHPRYRRPRPPAHQPVNNGIEEARDD